MAADFEERVAAAVRDPKHFGAMEGADAEGSAGSAGCGDMLRVWLKFKERRDGRRVIDRATFQGFGCETALAVASVAAEMLAGKTEEEARGMTGPELAAPLGALPPVKVHCATLVEEALRRALDGARNPEAGDGAGAAGLSAALGGGAAGGKKLVFLDPAPGGPQGGGGEQQGENDAR